MKRIVGVHNVIDVLVEAQLDTSFVERSDIVQSICLRGVEVRFAVGPGWCFGDFNY